MVKQLEMSGFFAPLQSLPTLIHLQLTAKDKQVTVNARAQLDLTLRLAAGPLRMRKVVFLILDAEFEEILLGRNLMNALGIDVERH